MISPRLTTVLLLNFLILAPVLAAPATYRERALEVTKHIQDTFWIPTSGLYSKTPTDKSPEFMWGNGVMFSALVGAARHDPVTYRPVMRKFFAAMNGYWDTKVKIPGYEPGLTQGGGNDKYYDDNAWMVLTFIEAYELTREAAYLQRADQTLTFVLSGWDEEDGGGIWWHEAHKGNGKNTCVNAPAAVGCLKLAKYRDPTKARQLIARARTIVNWTAKTFQAEDGLFEDSKDLTTGKKNRAKLTYNSALMLRAYLDLYRLTRAPEDLAAAKRIGKAADWFADKTTGVYRDAIKWSHLMVEADLDLYRETKEPYLLLRAKTSADGNYESWRTKHPPDMIDNASLARELWLLADLEAGIGRAR